MYLRLDFSLRHTSFKGKENSGMIVHFKKIQDEDIISEIGHWKKSRAKEFLLPKDQLGGDQGKRTVR